MNSTPTTMPMPIPRSRSVNSTATMVIANGAKCAGPTRHAARQSPGAASLNPV
jgi:hypothetical protein